MRGGDRKRITLDESLICDQQTDDDVLAVHEALARLEARDPRLARVVELRFFAGLSFAETADALGVTERTVYRLWNLARVLLFRIVRA